LVQELPPAIGRGCEGADDHHQHAAAVLPDHGGWSARRAGDDAGERGIWLAVFCLAGAWW